MKNEVERLTIVIAVRTGSPLTLDGFRTNFRKELWKVGLLGLKPNLTFHGLRKNATGALVEAGCTEEQAKSITGHKTTQMINKYAIGVRQERLAKQVQNICETQKQQKC